MIALAALLQFVDTVRLLLSVAPDVFAGDIFAMKGGTAINLFLRDMPPLSVATSEILENRSGLRITVESE